MRRRRFPAIVAAIAIGMVFLSAPTAAFATEPGEDYEDMIDDGDEDAEGEQTTIAAPGVDDGTGGGSSGTSSGTGTSSGSSSSGSSSGTSSGSSTASSAKSSDSSLASLGISPGSLSPAFSPGTYEYSATVDANVTQVSIPARPNSSKAVIASVSGAKSIRPGTNTVKVVVEAENGTTSTYTITVHCGQGAQDTPVSQPLDMPEPTSVEGEIGDTEPIGEIGDMDEEEEPGEEDSQVTFDSNGYLIYEGNAYIPSEMMPEGEYVSLDKYNKLYDQAQSDKTKSNRLLIIFVVALVLLAIVIVNLAFKLRDVRQDAKLGIGGLDDDDEGGLLRKEKKTPKAPKVPERTIAVEKTKPVARTKMEQKPIERPTVQKVPEKKTSVKRADRDLEILDLNDL